MSGKHTHFSRRDFIRISGTGIAGVTVGGAMLAPTNALGYVNKDQINPSIDNTRVVYAQDTNMTTGVIASTWDSQNTAVYESVVSQNIDKMACALAEEADIPNAWNKIFLKPDGKNWNEVVLAIKVNCINTRQMPRNAIVKKFCEVLINQMGVAGSNIHIYDGVHGGLMPTYTGLPTGVTAEGTWGGLNTTVYLPPPLDANAQCVQSIANGTVDIIINLAVCKGHDTFTGRVTMTMKNHFGTFSPTAHSTERIIAINKSETLLGAMDPGTGQIVFPRQQVCFVDALWSRNDGPGGTPDACPNALFMGTFAPVVDYLVSKRFRAQPPLSYTINTAVVDQFLSAFGYTEVDLTNDGQMVDALTWEPTSVSDWHEF